MPENSIKLQIDQIDHTRWPVDTIRPQHPPVWIPVPPWRRLLRPMTVGRSRLQPDTTGTCCCRASSEDQVFFSGFTPFTGTGTFTPAVAYAPAIPTAAPKSPATTLTNPLRRNLAEIYSHSLAIQDNACTPPRYHTPCHLAESVCIR